MLGLLVLVQSKRIHCTFQNLPFRNAWAMHDFCMHHTCISSLDMQHTAGQLVFLAESAGMVACCGKPRVVGQ